LVPIAGKASITRTPFGSGVVGQLLTFVGSTPTLTVAVVLLVDHLAVNVTGVTPDGCAGRLETVNVSADADAALAIAATSVITTRAIHRRPGIARMIPMARCAVNGGAIPPLSPALNECGLLRS
jgi:hypothetical protein